MRGLGGGGKGGVPVEEAGATVAGKQFALAELVPGLGPDAHAATGALLIINAGNASASGGAEAVEAGERLRIDEGAEGFALEVEGGLLEFELGLAEADALAGLVQGGGERFNLGAGSGERGFLGLGALQAGEGLVFHALGLGLGKVKLMLVGLGLIVFGEGVLLVAVAGSLLAVGGDLAIQAGTERFLAAECGGGLGGLTLCGGKGGLGLGNLSRQGAGGLGKARAFQLNRLQLYEIFNLRLHP